MSSWNGVYVAAASYADFPTRNHNVKELDWHRTN